MKLLPRYFYFCGLWAVCCLLATEAAAQSTPKRPTPSSTASSSKAAPAAAKIQVSPDAFPNVPAAMATLLEGLTKNNRELVNKAEGWLALQQEKAVPGLADILKSESSSPEMRIAACRALGRVGPAAAPVLIETLGSDSASAQLKLKATETLSYVRPPSQAIVDRLVEILRGDDARMRQIALQGLGRIGPPAKSATSVLMDILNNTAESETIRGEAKRALKEVDPRRGLQGIAPKK